MSSGLISLIKTAALDAVNDAKLADVRQGKVIQINPLKVQISDTLPLPASVLVVPEHLTDRDISIQLTGTTESFTSMKLLNGLQVGDRVMLIRKEGGQLYYIIDRI